MDGPWLHQTCVWSVSDLSRSVKTFMCLQLQSVISVRYTVPVYMFPTVWFNPNMMHMKHVETCAFHFPKPPRNVCQGVPPSQWAHILHELTKDSRQIWSFRKKYLEKKRWHDRLQGKATFAGSYLAGRWLIVKFESFSLFIELND